MRIAAIILALALAGCASQAPITATPLSDGRIGFLPNLHTPSSIEDGLKEAAANLDGAVKVGALLPDDPAPKCLHAVMADLGLGPSDLKAPSFTPSTDTVLGKGAVAYIRARQAQRAAGAGQALPASCKELVGQFVIDAGRAGVKGLPGGGMLPVLR